MTIHSYFYSYFWIIEALILRKALKEKEWFLIKDWGLGLKKPIPNP